MNNFQDLRSRCRPLIGDGYFCERFLVVTPDLLCKSAPEGLEISNNGSLLPVMPRKLQFFKISLYCSLALCLLAPMGALCAETSLDKKVDVKIDASFTPVSAVGIITSPGNVSQKPNALFHVVEGQGIIVSVPYEANEITDETVVTAYITGANGEQAFGEVRPINNGAGPFWNIATCPPGSPTLPVQASDEGVLELLIQTREARLKFAKKSISEALQGNFLERLQNFEKGFGMTRSTPLNAELSATEIIGRLSMLKEAIRNHEIRKEQKEEALPEVK